DALGHLAAAAARHEWCRTAIQHVVHAQEVAAADLEDVTEALRGEESGARALALEHGIDADRRAVDREPTVGEIDARLIDAPQDAVNQPRRSAESLGVDDGSRGLVERDEVRERPTDIDADPECHRAVLLARAVYPKVRRDAGSAGRRDDACAALRRGHAAVDGQRRAANE